MKRSHLILLIALAAGVFAHASVFACTIFCLTFEDKVYFCNNEDWKDPITDIRFHPAKDGGYAWVYLGFSNRWAQGGVNEHGLCFDWVACGGPFGWKKDPDKKDFKGNLSEKMLRTCRNVEEAIELFQKYNQKHFDYSVTLIADKDGNSVLISWKDGQLHFDRKQGHLQRFGAGEGAVDEALGELPESVDIDLLAGVLDAARSEGENPTRYSNIILPAEGKMYLFQEREFDRYLEIDFAAKLKEEYVSVRIAELFESPGEHSHVQIQARKSQ